MRAHFWEDLTSEEKASERTRVVSELDRLYALSFLPRLGALAGAGGAPLAPRDVATLLLKAAQRMHRDDPEHFEGGCADISEVLAQAAKAAGINNVQVVYGEVHHRNGDITPHAWLSVSGRVFDPTWTVQGWLMRTNRYVPKPSIKALLYFDPMLDDDEDPYQFDIAVGVLRRGLHAPLAAVPSRRDTFGLRGGG